MFVAQIMYVDMEPVLERLVTGQGDLLRSSRGQRSSDRSISRCVRFTDVVFGPEFFKQCSFWLLRATAPFI